MVIGEGSMNFLFFTFFLPVFTLAGGGVGQVMSGQSVVKGSWAKVNDYGSVSVRWLRSNHGAHIEIV